MTQYMWSYLEPTSEDGLLNPSLQLAVVMLRQHHTGEEIRQDALREVGAATSEGSEEISVAQEHLSAFLS